MTIRIEVENRDTCLSTNDSAYTGEDHVLGDVPRGVDKVMGNACNAVIMITLLETKLLCYII